MFRTPTRKPLRLPKPLRRLFQQGRPEGPVRVGADLGLSGSASNIVVLLWRPWRNASFVTRWSSACRTTRSQWSISAGYGSLRRRHGHEPPGSVVSSRWRWPWIGTNADYHSCRVGAGRRGAGQPRRYRSSFFLWLLMSSGSASPKHWQPPASTRCNPSLRHHRTARSRTPAADRRARSTDNGGSRSPATAASFSAHR